VCRLVDAELREDLLDVRAAHEELAIEHRDRASIRENPEVRIGDPALQLAQLGLAILEDLRILDRDEAIVDALGRELLRHGVVHQPPSDVDLAHAAFEEALSIQRALVSERPLSPLLKQDLAYTLGEYGTSLGTSRQALAALKAYEERLALNRDLAAADPKDAGATLAVAFSLHSLGETLALLERRTEALVRYREAGKEYDAVLAHDPENSWAAVHRAWLDTTEGRARRQLGESDRACALFLRSAASLEELEKNGRLSKAKASYLTDARKERDACAAR